MLHTERKKERDNGEMERKGENESEGREGMRENCAT